jgi:hypothetical protein
MDLEGMLRLTESYGRASSVTFKSINQKKASRCLLLMWRGRKFSLSKMSSYLKVLVLLKNLL